MNKNTTNVIIGIVLLVFVGWLIYYLSSNNTPTTVTNTSTTVTTPTTTSTPSSTTQTSSPVADAPVVVTNPSTTVSSSTALVSGTVKPNGAATTYWFEYGLSTTLGNRTTAQAIGSGYSTISTPSFITGLKADTLYYFRLSAKNSFGTVNGDTLSFTTNEATPPKLTLPTVRTVSATSIDRMSSSVNGLVNPNGSDTIYWFEYGSTTNFGFITSPGQAGGGSTSSTVSAALSGLQPLTKYYFRLNAQNQYGTVNGSTLSFVTIGPAVPGQPSVSTAGAGSITSASANLSGRINPNGVATTYWFEYSINPNLRDLQSTVSQTTVAGTSTVTIQTGVANLNPSTKYYYRLVGQNQYGTVYGNIVSFTTSS